MESIIKILVISPRSLISELLISGFTQREKIRVVAHATSEEEVTEAFRNHSIDVCLIDYDAQGADYECQKILRRLREGAPSVRSVVLLAQREHDVVVECFRAGAKGVFPKNAAEFNLLCKSIYCVHNGQVWASSEELIWMLSALESSYTQPAPLRVVNEQGANLLSKREEDVVRNLMEGFSNREIAQNLKLSEHTVKNYLFRIFDKLGVSSRTELLLYAMSSRRLAGPSSEVIEASALAS
jgi:DNA-binding NarL/FixJ family response regulator